MSKLQLPVTITPTRAELGARCHRRHFLADVLGKARYVSPSLAFGSVVHAGVAAHWLGQDVRGALSVEWSKQKLESDSAKLTLAMAEAMLDHYAQNAQLAGPFTSQGNFKLVDVEQRFEIPLKDAILSFQCDRVAYDKEQNWMVITDSKTAGRLDAKWDRQWETSIQMKLYRAGAKQVFDTGGRIDIVVEGLLKDIPSFIRYYVCPEWSDGLLVEAGHNAHTIATMDAEVLMQGSDVSQLSIVGADGEIDKTQEERYVINPQKVAELAVRYTPVNYMDCFSYGVECPFRRICTADVDQRVPILNAEYFDIEGEY